MSLPTNLGPGTRVISRASKRDRTTPTSLIFLSFLCVTVAAEPLPLGAQPTSIIQRTVSDQQHLAIVRAEIKINGPILASEIEITSDVHRIVSHSIAAWVRCRTSPLAAAVVEQYQNVPATSPGQAVAVPGWAGRARGAAN